LAALVDAALKKLPIPKMMRWGDREEEFVRPVRGLVMLHGERIVPGTVRGQSSGRTTRGHRFLSKGTIEIARADDYDALLERDGIPAAPIQTIAAAPVKATSQVEITGQTLDIKSSHHP
jgi:glycyl-tRNA synthetase beta chain